MIMRTVWRSQMWSLEWLWKLPEGLRVGQTVCRAGLGESWTEDLVAETS